MLQIELRKLSDLKPHPDNPRKAVKGGIEKLAESIKGNPEYFNARPIVVSDRTGVLTIIDGERRSEAAAYLGMAEVPTIVMSGLTYEQELEILIKGNTHTGVWDEMKLKQWSKEQLTAWGERELARLQKLNESKENYTRKVEIPIYEPKSEFAPEITELCDTAKYDELVEIINASRGISKEIKSFLKMAACRHIVFDYEKIAEYYAHAPKQIQELFEDSALVIIDYDKAIRGGVY